MNTYTPVITQQGLNAAVSAHDQGIKIEIAQIAVGDQGYIAHRDQIQLKNERNRVDVSGGKVVGAGHYNVTGTFKDTAQYAVREVGFFLNDQNRTLFAVWSHPENALFYQTPLAQIVQGFDLILNAVPGDSIDIHASGDLNLFYGEEFLTMALAQTKMASAQIQSNLRQIAFNEQLIQMRKAL
ncbi:MULTISPECIES: phage tail protein [Pseudoalteromonas]|uniref:Phage tail protein n=1 Tax=Pseudoalteromonas rubra TaxID=43658 RepID=A0A5S3URY6_9GAMM|nr:MULTISPECIES: phage tail protein [Pseudoalteromonas]MCG7560774.1 phage tail protein [Pseudoalteromonas sp. McH1-42]MEC4090569.1 phage tail protein [Pseudoalteromonas rubra]QPB82493.1 phage tail protein [Pseudoalteromonas rubra]